MVLNCALTQSGSVHVIEIKEVQSVFIAIYCKAEKEIKQTNALNHQTSHVGSTGILLPKLFWPTVRKNCSSDREKLLKFEAEGHEFAKCLRSLEQFIQTEKGQNNFW